ncbi:Acyl-protein thioesterase 2 (APT-2) (Lysophospholipase 2) (Lysophospholipase II) (LPL-II) (LysoPLA II) (mLyso II) [Durusdinium trenchii]|uniref:Acyl-protein thioesterase 2 (APT-2) (Lysophospholipase 2) (Lysophospholipase II) (LPL-II) (LysoPLA II) (MLyso II) n=1 Tax=Durusdinium trenchii TaxID=1381693 RepID=A0ABP0HEU5_9DINO
METPTTGFSFARTPGGAEGGPGSGSPLPGGGQGDVARNSSGKGPSGSGLDWLRAEALARHYTSRELGGDGGDVVFSREKDGAFFPARLADLLDCVPVSSSDVSSSVSAKTGNLARTRFVERLSEELDLGKTDCEMFLQGFLDELDEAQIGCRRAEHRKREILKVVQKNGSKRQIVEDVLKKAQTFAELDAIDSVVGLVSLGEAKFKSTLEADLKLARDSTQEITFGILSSDETLRKAETQYRDVQRSILSIVELLAQVADDRSNRAQSDAAWHAFATEFIREHHQTLVDKVFECLERDDLARNLEALLLRVLYYLDLDGDKGLQRMLRSGRRLQHRLTWVFKMLKLVVTLDKHTDEMRGTIVEANCAPVSLVWTVFTKDAQLFEESYAAGFEFLAGFRIPRDFGDVLEAFLTRAISVFEIHEYLQQEADFSFMAKICVSAFEGRSDACDEVWRDPDHPVKRLLGRSAAFASPFLELCGGLVASPNSANYALAFVQQVSQVGLQNLALIANLLEHLERRVLLERFDIAAFCMRIVRSHTRDPHFIKTMRNFALRFPQLSLTAISNEPDRSTFTVLDIIKEDLSAQNETGDYERLIHGLEMLRALLGQVEREQYASELKLAFPTDSDEVSLDALLTGLSWLGHNAGIDDTSFRNLVQASSSSAAATARATPQKSSHHSKGRGHRRGRRGSRDQIDSGQDTFKLSKLEQFLQNGSDSFFRVVALTLQERRTQIERFIMQMVKLVREIFRSHRGWRFSNAQQKWRIGVLTTKILHACVSMPSGPDSIRSRVADSIMNDASTQAALMSNVLSLRVVNVAEQELVHASLELLQSVLVLDDYYPNKMNLLCHQELMSGLASYISLPRPKDRIPCAFPISELAVRVLEGFVRSMHVTRTRNLAPGGMPSMVAALSKAPFLQEDIARSIRNEQLASISMLMTALELDPGFAAMLLKHEDILKSTMDILSHRRNFANKPGLYSAALECVGVLWYKGYTSTIHRLQEMFPDFWEVLTHPLFQDIAAPKQLSGAVSVVADHSLQIYARAWALEIMTIELENNGVGGTFLDLMKKLRREDRDRAWLEQYSEMTVKFPSLMSLERQARGSAVTNLAAFRHAESHSFVLCADAFLLEHRLQRDCAVYIYDTEVLQRVFPDQKGLAEAVLDYNCVASLCDAQQLLLRAWKTYMETRCLIMWDDEDPPGLLGTPRRTGTGSGVATPDNGNPDVRRSRALSSVTSKHWGDMTSYTLVVELAKRLRTVDASQLGELQQQQYVVAVAELFTSMLHFKIFEKVPDAEVNDTVDLLDQLVLLPRIHFRKRPAAMRGEKLRLSNEDTCAPGTVQLIEWVRSSLAKFLQQSQHSFLRDVVLSLLTALLMLFEVAIEDDNPDEPLKELGVQQEKALHLISAVLETLGQDAQVVDVSLPLLNLILLHSGKTCDLEFLAGQSTFAILLQAFRRHSESLANSYGEQRELCRWMEIHGLSDLRVKVLGTHTSAGTAGPPSASVDGPPVNQSDSQDRTTPVLDREEQQRAAQKAQENQQVREMAQRLGYRTFVVNNNKNKMFTNYRNVVNKGQYSGQDGLMEVSVIHLLFDFGVTSIAALKSLDNRAMQNMGIYKQSDRRRLLDIIVQGSAAWEPNEEENSRRHMPGPKGTLEKPQRGQSSNRQQSEKKMNEPLAGAGDHNEEGAKFSRQIGFEKKLEMKRALLRMQLILRVLVSAMSCGDRSAAVGAHLASLNVIRELAQDPLLRAVAGNKAFAASLDNRRNQQTITYRGYTVQRERDPAHLVWGQSLHLVSTIVGWDNRHREVRNVEQAFEFINAHRGTMLSSLEAFKFSDSIFTLGGLEEAQHVVSVLRVCAVHSQRWRMQGNVNTPLLTAAWGLAHDLVEGNDGQRRTSLLEEFVHTFFSSSRMIPKLCLSTQAITAQEIKQDRTPVMRSLQTNPMVGTPRTAPTMQRSSSIIADMQERDREDGVVKTDMVISHLTDGDISSLHAAIEFRICRVVQHILALMRNRKIVKSSNQLQIDEQTMQLLPPRYWGKAVIPFPLRRSAASATPLDATAPQGGQQHQRREPQVQPLHSADTGHTAQAPAHSGPSVATLMSILGYARYRLNLARSMHLQQDKLPAYEREAQRNSRDLNTSNSDPWIKVLHYLVTSSLYALWTALDLSIHEHMRLDAQVSGKGVQAAGGPQLIGDPKRLEEIRAKVTALLEKFHVYFDELLPEDDGGTDILVAMEDEIMHAISVLISLADVQPQTVAGSGSVRGGATPKRTAAQAALTEYRNSPRSLNGLQQGAVDPVPEVLVIPSSCSPCGGVIIWLHGAFENPANWQAVFQNFNLPEVEFRFPDSRANRRASVAAPALEHTVLCWFKDGCSVPEPKSNQAGRPPRNGLSEALALSNGVAVVRAVLEKAQREVADFKKGEGEKRDAAKLKSLVELFALVTSMDEDRESICQSLEHVQRLVEEKIRQGVPANKILLGGFQQGGGVALLVSLMFAMEEPPILLGGAAAINSYLPLATELAQGVAHCLAARKSKSVSFPPVLLCNAEADRVVNKGWAEMTARALHAAGVQDVQFDLFPGLDHFQWSMDEMRMVWELASRMLKG